MKIFEILWQNIRKFRWDQGGGYPGTVKTPRPNKIIPYKFNNTNDQSHFRSSLQNYRHEETETANLTLLPIRGFETTLKTRDLYSAKRG